jgi:hypothetical protein
MKHMLFKILLAMSISITANAQNSSRKIGPVYLASNTSQCVLSVIETKDKSVYHYQLQLNDCKTAALIRSKEIIVAKKQIEQEQIIGRMGNVLWILADSLTGYDVNTLEVAVTETGIASINPFMQNNFSRLHNSYLLDEAAQVMYISAENGDRYKLYPDIKMIPDSSSSDKVPDDFNYEFAADYKLYGKYNLKYVLSCIDTLNSRLYIMGSPKETSQVLSYFGVSIYPERDEPRQLTTIPFAANDDKVDYSRNKPVTVAKKYFGAAFLQNKFYTTTWHGKNGEHIILYRNGAGSKATLSIAMLDKSGKEKWNWNTGIAYLNFNDYLIAENSLLLWMDAYSNGKQTQKLFYISLEDGKTQIQ